MLFLNKSGEKAVLFHARSEDSRSSIHSSTTSMYDLLYIHLTEAVTVETLDINTWICALQENFFLVGEPKPMRVLQHS